MVRFEANPDCWRLESTVADNNDFRRGHILGRAFKLGLVVYEAEYPSFV